MRFETIANTFTDTHFRFLPPQLGPVRTLGRLPPLGHTGLRTLVTGTLLPPALGVSLTVKGLRSTTGQGSTGPFRQVLSGSAS